MVFISSHEPAPTQTYRAHQSLSGRGFFFWGLLLSFALESVFYLLALSLSLSFSFSLEPFQWPKHGNNLLKIAWVCVVIYRDIHRHLHKPIQSGFRFLFIFSFLSIRIQLPFTFFQWEQMERNRTLNLATYRLYIYLVKIFKVGSPDCLCEVKIEEKEGNCRAPGSFTDRKWASSGLPTHSSRLNRGARNDEMNHEHGLFFKF